MTNRQAARRGGQVWLILLVASLLALPFGAWWSVRPRSAVVTSASGQLDDPEPSQPVITQPVESPTAAKRRGPGRPKKLIVSRLGISVPIVATTVDDRGQMELPARPSEIGWYAYGPKPGSAAGSAVLAGHVDSRRFGVGPLVRLQRARPGDVVVVQADIGSADIRGRPRSADQETGPRSGPALRSGGPAGAADRDLRWPLSAPARGIPGQCRCHGSPAVNVSTHGVAVRPRVQSGG